MAEIQLFGNLESEKNPNIEKIAVIVVQIKFLEKHITNQKLCFYIFTVGNLQNFFMEHDFWHTRKIIPGSMVPRGNETLRREMLKIICVISTNDGQDVMGDVMTRRLKSTLGATGVSF